MEAGRGPQEPQLDMQGLVKSGLLANFDIDDPPGSQGILSFGALIYEHRKTERHPHFL